MLRLEMCVAPAKSKEHPGCFCVTESQPVPVIVLQMGSPETCYKGMQNPYALEDAPEPLLSGLLSL